MRSVSFCALALALFATTACKKKGTGGGGGWFVGEEGLMANVGPDGEPRDGYELGATATLHAIACRYLDEAWVVGDDGLVLYTSDAGASWDTRDVGTAARLRGLATQDSGPVFLAGDGVFLTAIPTADSGAATWTDLGDGTTRFTQVVAAQRGTTVLALADDGALWAHEEGALMRRATLPGTRSIAIAPDGLTVFAAGAGLSKSVDGGVTWTAIEAALDGELHSIRVDQQGEAIAAGDAGLVVRVDVDGRVLSQRVGTQTLRSLHIAPSGDYSGVGYAAGDGGQTWITLDDGWTWTEGPNVGGNVLAVDEVGEGHN